MMPFSSWDWWERTIIQATEEAEAGKSQDLSYLQSELKTSLGNGVKPHRKIKSKKDSQASTSVVELVLDRSKTKTSTTMWLAKELSG